MEINASSLEVFYVSRIFGYAPYRIERTVSGKLNRIFSSVLLKLYSIGLLFTLVVLCTFGLIRDVEAEVSLRMKSTTSKIATVLDVNVVVASCLFGVISGCVGFHQMQEINRRLKEADDILFIYIGQDNQSKGRGMVLVLLIFTAILSILALDVYGWYRQALKIMRTNSSAVNVVNNLYWYIPFYTLYVFLMTLQIQFTHTSWGLGRRYRRLNLALNSMSFGEQLFFHKKNVAFNTSTINEYRKKINVTNAFRRDRAADLHNICFKNLSYIHESLGKVVNSISSYFGLTLLMLLSSCLLHLTVTSYFVILTLIEENDHDLFHITLQFVWLTFHTFRLLLIVEPCNMTRRESSHTIRLVSNILRNRANSAVVLSTITTYMVILLQFEKVYG